MDRVVDYCLGIPSRGTHKADKDITLRSSAPFGKPIGNKHTRNPDY
jgi:hypothetical protein